MSCSSRLSRSTCSPCSSYSCLPLGVDQAVIQLTALGISLAVAIGGGLVTGIIINIPFLTSPLNDTELFDDFQIWEGPDQAEPAAKDTVDMTPAVERRWSESTAPRRESVAVVPDATELDTRRRSRSVAGGGK